MLQFVVLIHDFPAMHWDFMLEKEAALRTWRLSLAPNASSPIAATALPDHRLAYLDYEGPVSGNRGEVHRWDRGTYSVLEETEARLIIRLDGRLLHGVADFKCSGSEGEWGLYFTPDAGSTDS